MAIVTIGVLFFVLLIFNYIEKKNIEINKSVLYYFVFGIIICFLFIKLAKSFAVVKTEHYLSVNNIGSIKAAILLIKKSFIEVLTFKTKEIFVSIYSYCVILFLIAFSTYILKKKVLLILFSNKWFSFFIADFIVIFITFILSSWVLANGMGRWYFVASYISLSMAVLIAIEHLQINNYPIMIYNFFLLVIIIIGAISPIYNMKYIYPKTLRPMVDVVGEFKQLGKIGVLAEFWNSYITSCPDPEMIKATPHDQSDIRNQQLVDEVFERKNLYVIKDMWMNSFPDTLEQFGYVLLKEGNHFILGNCDVCKYKKIKLQKYIPISKLKYKESQILFDHSIQRNVLVVSSGCDTCREKYFVYGPYIPIGIGDFTIRFYMKASHSKNDNSIALLDVSVDGGRTQLSSKKINKTELTGNIYKYFDLDFKTTKRYIGMEFRIYYYGNADLYFDHLELIEK